MKPYDRLIEHNIKPSMQRIAIMEFLMEHPIHPSADDIYMALSPSMPTLSKTTVYNTLKLFSEQGAALMLTIDEKNTNFDADTSMHSHFLCRKDVSVFQPAVSLLLPLHFLINFQSVLPPDIQEFYW